MTKAIEKLGGFPEVLLGVDHGLISVKRTEGAVKAWVGYAQGCVGFTGFGWLESRPLAPTERWGRIERNGNRPQEDKLRLGALEGSSPVPSSYSGGST